MWRIAAHSTWFRLRLGLSRNALLGELRLGHVSFKVPVRCDGYGSVRVEDGVHIGSEMAPRFGNGEVLLQTRAKAARIQIGESTRLSNNVSCVAAVGVSIGAHCLIGDGVSIFDCDFHELDPRRRWSGPGVRSPVLIADNVWIGSRALILKGVRIGKNSVVAAGSVVTRDVPDDVVVGGNPARVLRRFNGGLDDSRYEGISAGGGDD